MCDVHMCSLSLSLSVALSLHHVQTCFGEAGVGRDRHFNLIDLAINAQQMPAEVLLALLPCERESPHEP